MASVVEQTRASGDGFAAGSALRLGRKEQLVEVLVFLFLIVPSMVLGLLLIHKQPERVGFVLVAVSILLRDVGLAALIFFFLWRNGESISRVGWRFRAAWREVLLGVVLYVPFFGAMLALDRLFVRLGLSQPTPGAEAFLKPHGAAQLVLAGVLVVVVAITEETIFRGYLLLRFSAVSRSMAFAVVLSSFIFSIGHGYEGGAGVATVGMMGVIFALVYLWRRSLVAPVTIHFLQDFIAIVVVSALAGT
jgi:membrane protease YdiL (CAAX protease family)